MVSLPNFVTHGAPLRELPAHETRAPLLLQIIHHNQNAYMKGRTIFDAVRTIDDVISFMALKNISSLMIVIDFEKAFDSVN